MTTRRLKKNAKMRKSKRSAFKSAKRRAMNRRKMVGGLSEYNFVVNQHDLQSYLKTYEIHDLSNQEILIGELVGYGIVKIKKSGSIFSRTEQISIFQCMDPLDTSVVKRYAIVRCPHHSCVDVGKSGATPIREGIPNLGMEDKVLFIDNATQNNSVPNSFHFQNSISSRDKYNITIPEGQEENNLIEFFVKLSKNGDKVPVKYSEDVTERAKQLNDAKMRDVRIMSSRGPPLRFNPTMLPM